MSRIAPQYDGAGAGIRRRRPSGFPDEAPAPVAPAKAEKKLTGGRRFAEGVPSKKDEISWVPEPSHADQFMQLGQWRVARTQIKQLRMDKPRDEKELEALLALARPAGAPRALVGTKKEFWQGVWHVLVEIRHLEYKKLFNIQEK